MNQSTGQYIPRLVGELRRRGVPGEVVGDVVAQVESHLAEAGGDPVSSFGSPAEYAAAIAETVPRRHRWGTYVMHGVVGAVLAAVCAAAIVGLARGEARTFGLDSTIVLVVGVGALVVYGIALIITMRRRVRDPRKGTGT